MLNMNEESQSSSSSTPPSPTSTESSILSSSNSENLNPTANWNWNDSLTEPTTTTIDDYSFPSSSAEGSDDGIYEDRLGHNPSSERIVEPQSDIPEKSGELMINRSPQDVLVAAETVCGKSDDISSPGSLLNDLNINRVQGVAYTERQELSFSSGNMEPVGVEYSSRAVTSSRSPVESEEIVALVDSSLTMRNRFHSAVTASRSPVESEEIVALVDSSPSPMIRPRPPQPPLIMENRDEAHGVFEVFHRLLPGLLLGLAGLIGFHFQGLGIPPLLTSVILLNMVTVVCFMKIKLQPQDADRPMFRSICLLTIGSCLTFVQSCLSWY